MRTFFTFILLLGLISEIYSQCADPSNIYTFNFGGKTYEVVKEQKSWDAAALCAIERGGSLVEIGSIAEQQAVYNAITTGANVPSNYTVINNGGGIAYVWIGATDNVSEGDWKWDGDNDNTGISFWSGTGSTGSVVNNAYNNWGGTSTGTTNEPDNYGNGQHHGAIGLAGWPSGSTMLGSASEWNDIIGSSLLYFVIEKDATSIQENKSEKYIQVYPNPTGGEFFIEIDKFEKIILFDTMGKQIKEFTETKIDISNLPQGIYYLQIKTSETVVSKKIILQ